ncbi:DUF2807 domain-containing protein [Robertkochia marina]|uniref:DUF2807 domain-containing protein n=1 Tax=Robertkochia marina TaxID=1227945 RepID=A0A4S3M515_9FLAO|nr:head GIN domain-containing protein [Robertkochia marina]THD69307.1 DUF2807 domain-containing protein [Robertkochia marina]TRZ47433.1 DUF2807 domain-containing protein [Robertkochia marina]
MMKNLIAVVCFCWAVIGSAQETNEMNVERFSELKVFDGISVNLIPSDVNKLVITGEYAENVVAKNSNGTLKLRLGVTTLFKDHDTSADLYYSGPLSVLDVNENAKITSKETLKQVDLELRAQEGGEIQLDVALEILRIKVISGSTIGVTGRSTNQEVNVNTGGGYEAGNLETEQTDVKVNAGGYADIRASKYVNARVNAGGNINIYGKPGVIDQTKFLGGTIKEIQ